jgi:predicted HicB family RNase H-like nuclease
MMADRSFKVTISEEHVEKLTALAERKGVSINELIEQFIDDASDSPADSIASPRPRL